MHQCLCLWLRLWFCNVWRPWCKTVLVRMGTKGVWCVLLSWRSVVRTASLTCRAAVGEQEHECWSEMSEYQFYLHSFYFRPCLRHDLRKWFLIFSVFMCSAIARYIVNEVGGLSRNTRRGSALETFRIVTKLIRSWQVLTDLTTILRLFQHYISWF